MRESKNMSFIKSDCLFLHLSIFGGKHDIVCHLLIKDGMMGMYIKERHLCTK